MTLTKSQTSGVMFDVHWMQLFAMKMVILYFSKEEGIGFYFSRGKLVNSHSSDTFFSNSVIHRFVHFFTD